MGIKSNKVDFIIYSQNIRYLDECMKTSNAKYKVYLQDNTIIIDDMFLYSIIKIFQKNSSVAILGIYGKNASGEYGRNIVGTEFGTEETYFRLYIADILSG